MRSVEIFMSGVGAYEFSRRFWNAGQVYMVHSDVSAVLAVARHQGLWKFRHIRGQWLWLQEKSRGEHFRLLKGNGKERLAVFMIKHLAVEESRRFLTMMVMGLQLRSDKSSKLLSIGNVRGTVNHIECIKASQIAQGPRNHETRSSFVTRK